MVPRQCLTSYTEFKDYIYNDTISALISENPSSRVKAIIVNEEGGLVFIQSQQHPSQNLFIGVVEKAILFYKDGSMSEIIFSANNKPTTASLNDLGACLRSDVGFFLKTLQNIFYGKQFSYELEVPSNSIISCITLNTENNSSLLFNVHKCFCYCILMSLH